MAQPHQSSYVATYFSIDVECVASGTQHNAREVAQIALVDQYERCLLNVYVKPPEGTTVASYLTPLTGRDRRKATTHPATRARRLGFFSFFFHVPFSSTRAEPSAATQTTTTDLAGPGDRA